MRRAILVAVVFPFSERCERYCDPSMTQRRSSFTVVGVVVARMKKRRTDASERDYEMTISALPPPARPPTAFATNRPATIGRHKRPKLRCDESAGRRSDETDRQRHRDCGTEWSTVSQICYFSWRVKDAVRIRLRQTSELVSK